MTGVRWQVGRVDWPHRGESSHPDPPRIKALSHLHFLFHILSLFFNQYQNHQDFASKRLETSSRIRVHLAEPP